MIENFSYRVDTSWKNRFAASVPNGTQPTSSITISPWREIAATPMLHWRAVDQRLIRLHPRTFHDSPPGGDRNGVPQEPLARSTTSVASGA